MLTLNRNITPGFIKLNLKITV